MQNTLLQPAGWGPFPFARASATTKPSGERKRRRVRGSSVRPLVPLGSLSLLVDVSLADSEQSPGVYLRDDPVLGTQLQNHCELRVPSAERAAHYLDCALAARSDEDAHLLFTLHVYQYSVAGKGGGE